MFYEELQYAVANPGAWEHFEPTHEELAAIERQEARTERTGPFRGLRLPVVSLGPTNGQPPLPV